MMNELIEKIAAQTGQPVETVTPIVGALLAHLGDVLPAPLAHQLAVMLGIHQDDGTTGADVQPAAGDLLGGLAASIEGGGAGGGFAGATSLMNVAQSLLGGYLAGRR
jgi:hypothetical protein